MGYPTSGTTVQMRPDIVGAMEEFDVMADMEGFIGHRVFLGFDSMVQSGKFGKITLESLLQNAATERAPGSGYNRGQFRFTDQSFSTSEHGFEVPVDDREAKMYASYFDAEVQAGRRAMRQVLENYEKRVAAAVFDTSATGWDSGNAALFTSVGTEWSTAASATPRANVKAAKLKVRQNSGLMANALIISYNVYENLKDCDDILDRVKYTNRALPEDITADMLAEALGVRYLLVGNGLKNTANNAQAASLSDIWDDEYAMVCRIATNRRDIKEPCIGRTIHYTEDGSEFSDGDGTPPRVAMESYREEQNRSQIMRARHDVQELVLYIEAGHLLGNITA